MKTAFKCSLLLVVSIWLAAPVNARAGDDGLLKNELRMAHAAGVDNESLERVVAAARRQELSDENTVGWVAQIRETTRQGLPTAPLVNKIEEGVSKKIEARLIQSALVRLTNQLQFARALTDEAFPEHTAAQSAERNRSIVRISDLLSAGITQTEIKGLNEDWKPAPLKQKLDALTFYAVARQAGLQASEAKQIASAGIRHNHFHGFPLQLAMMIKAAKMNHIQSDEIIKHALKVIRGEQTVAQAHREMGIQQVRPNPERGFRNSNGRESNKGSRGNEGRSGRGAGGHGGGGGGGGGAGGGGGGAGGGGGGGGRK